VKKIDRLSAPEMLELAAKGAKVLHARCVELAMRHDVELCVLSSFVEGFGTIITNTKILEDQTQVENPKLSAIAHSLDDVIITYGDITEKPRDIQNRRLKTLLESLSQYQVSLSFMSYTPNQPFFFVIKKPDLERIRAILENLKTELSFDSLAINPNIVTLSLVGIGINRDSNLLPLVFETLSTHEIPILMMNTQEIKISLIIDYNHMTRALNALHQALFHDLLQDA
jgi:aspartate kinase